jgi:hypothetical protein
MVSRAAGQQVQWVRNGKIISNAPLTEGQSATLQVEAQPGDWFSLILRDDNGPTLFSNPIYIATRR